MNVPIDVVGAGINLIPLPALKLGRSESVVEVYPLRPGQSAAAMSASGKSERYKYNVWRCLTRRPVGHGSKLPATNRNCCDYRMLCCMITVHS